jgi:hypothetical protein
MKQQLLADITGIFKSYIYEDNKKIIPSSATLTVYKPGGDVKLVDGASMMVGSDGLLSYTLTSQDNSIADINYKAVITYIYGSDTLYATLFYDVVKSRLMKVVVDDDVVAELPQLKDNGWRVRGAVESGSTTTIVDSELKRYEDGFFTGGLAYSIDKDESREIADFVSSTGTVTTADFSTAISSGEKYILTRSYSREIQRAFEKIEDKLARLGKRPELVLDPYDLKEVHIYQSVAEVCKGLITESDNFWWEMWKSYESKADETFRAFNFKYDSSEDGYITGAEESTTVDVLRAGRR